MAAAAAAARPTSQQTLQGLLQAIEALPAPIDQYQFLRSLQADNADLFFQLLFAHTEQLLPLVYTPTVGQACQEYCQRHIATRGLYITAADSGRVLQKLAAWPAAASVALIVVTDGERILGLGDLGAGGMGISEGKCLLYTVAGGLPPEACLPVCLDVGTNNKQLLQGPAYSGLKQPRLTGAAYDALVAEFMGAAMKQFGTSVVVQFEDFANTNAPRLLEQWRHSSCCFNDDMQGTAAVALAGLLGGLRGIGATLEQQTFLFLGAGEAGTAIGELICQQLVRRHGLALSEARARCHFIDSRGLVCAARREQLQHHKLPFAHDRPFVPDLESAVAELQPSVLIGVAAQPGAFTARVLQMMGEISERPFIFPLSNPTSLAECTAEQALAATGGRCLFASGSPNPPLTLPDGRQVVPSQANNAYIFPSIGWAATLTRCTTITDEVFLEAAEALAAMSSHQQLQQGRLFPPLSSIRDAAQRLTCHLAGFMVTAGLGQLPERGLPAGGWAELVQQAAFTPAAPQPGLSKL